MTDRVDRGTRSPVEDAPILELRDVAIGYGQMQLASELNLRINAGSIVALLGPNGAGKTTTLRTIAGVQKPLHGEVLIDGNPIVSPVHRRVRAQGLGYITEDRAVIRRLTVMENLRLGSGDPSRALEMFPELRPLRQRRAGLLSGGEQQMLALGRCLAAAPRLLLVDELSFGLAPLIVRRLLATLVEICRSASIAVLLVEQHPTLALSIADYGYVLARGAVRLEGRGVDLLARSNEIESSYLNEISSQEAPLSTPAAGDEEPA